MALIRPLSASYGVRPDPIDGRPRFHRGIDVPAASGAPVMAAADGVVQRAGLSGGYGLMVEIDHVDGGRTRYAHLSSLNVKVGDRVAVASVIGHVGSTGRSTGPHLHFEYWLAGRAVDPMPFLNAYVALSPRLNRIVEVAKPHISEYSASKRVSEGRGNHSDEEELVLGAHM
jgi:murein DD-endopeptidase MepM/ murein hydrolase activator NlpD